MNTYQKTKKQIRTGYGVSLGYDTSERIGSSPVSSISVKSLRDLQLLNDALYKNKRQLIKSRRLEERFYTKEREISFEESIGRQHLRVVFDEKGQKVRRESYDERGFLLNVIIYTWESNGDLQSEQAYDAVLNFSSRKVGKFFEERNKSGKLRRKVEI